MSTLTVELDKSVESVLEEDYGTITIRVVVLEKGSRSPAPEDLPADAEPDEILAEMDTKRPIDSYLESPKRGRLCAVFLVNGQRQHAWDNSFIQRDLDLKYLRNRMLVIVDVDGLHPEAIARLMQGSRHQFYEGSVYAALSRRVIAILKGDPDLQRLEADAEQEVSSLQAGDEVVKAALDQLIESHHESGNRSLHGHRQAGAETRDEVTDGSLEQTVDVVVETEPTTGEPANAPSLVMRPDMSTIRLKPNEGQRIAFRSNPDDQWSNVERFALTLAPPVPELDVRHETQIDCATVDLRFTPGSDFDDDQYPIHTVLRSLASFKDHKEPRICERPIVINKPRKVGPPRPPLLLDEPTFLRVTSRQPVRMVIGGPDVHVKLRWDGKDELTIGDPPRWRFEANCDEAECLPTFTAPYLGRFELLLRVPEGLTAGDTLDFRVEAIGHGGRVLTTSFVVEVVGGPKPRRINEKIVGGSQRKPPYKLVYVNRDNWELETCWGSQMWTEEDPGCFQPPSQSEPLTLIINQDFGLLAEYRESLISGRSKLTESTVQDRVTRYTSHVAFHLWQMHEEMTRRQEAATNDPSIRPPEDDEMSSEIQRVAATLIKLMQVSR